MIYLASPYSHEDPAIKQERYMKVMEATARLLQTGHFIYSPIVHCHAMAVEYDLPTGFDFWKNYDFDMIESSEQLYVLCLDGWDRSIGVLAEIEFARSWNLTITYWEMGDDGEMSQSSEAPEVG